MDGITDILYLTEGNNFPLSAEKLLISGWWLGEQWHTEETWHENWYFFKEYHA